MSSLVSIIVPVYNVEPYLHHCVDSLLAQTYENIEIILVDDGSSDLCPEICDAYTQKDSRVRVIHIPNQGVSIARNTGIEHTNGELVLFVDGDDWIAPAMVSRMYEAIERNKADVCVCALKNTFSEDAIADTTNKEYIGYGKEEFFTRILNDTSCYGYSCNKMIRKASLGGIRFNQEFAVCEDMLFCTNLASVCSKIIQLKAELYYYRNRSDSATRRQNFSDKITTLIKAYESIALIYAIHSPRNLPIVHYNYLKINLNIKGRIIIDKIDNKNLMREINTNITKHLLPTLKSSHLSYTSKINIIFTWLMPRIILKLKQSILNLHSHH